MEKGASLVAPCYRIHLLRQETWVRSPGWEEPPRKEMGTHSSTFAWETPRTEQPGGLRSMGSQRASHDFVTKQ